MSEKHNTNTFKPSKRIKHMQFQNVCAVERRIKEINPEVDTKVRVIGTVVSKSESSFILDDGEGTVQVFIDPKEMQNITERKIVRVIGHVSPNGGSFDLRTEKSLIHDLTGLNLKTYETVQKLWKDAKMTG